jgi:hypothetical protein
MNHRHLGLDFADYLALDAISAHGLMLLERSPAHFWAARQTPHAATPAQLLGTLTHLCVLEPDAYRDRVRVAPDVDRRTKAGKETWEAFQAETATIVGALLATAEQDAQARAMRAAVMAQPFARALLADGAAEVSLTWDRAGLACKARPDWLCEGHAVIVDLKTALDAGPSAFAKACGQWKYHLQAAWYQDAAIACDLGERAFVFLAVEPAPPYAVGLYQLDEEALRVGRLRYQRALETYQACRTAGHWPGYDTEINTLSLPKWAL